MSTGNRIALLRFERGWTKTYLARYVGVNTKSVKDWENDVSLPNMVSIKKLCFIFHTTSDYLLELENRQVIVLDGLDIPEADRIRKIIQIFIDTSRPSIS